MSIREKLKKVLPSYRTERRMKEAMEELRQELREMDKKQEYLFWLSQTRPGETMQQAKERLMPQLPRATGRLRNIQLAENHILRRVKELCDANGLGLFLIGGTLLGAVRHRGFIPWDNDVDVGMLMPDYLKLRELLAKDPELSLEYYYNYEVGLRMSKVKFRAVDVFWIDIIVFDRIDATPEKAEAVWEESVRVNTAFSRQIRELTEPLRDSYPGRPTPNPALDGRIAALAAEQAAAFPGIGEGAYFFGSLDTPFWARDPRGIKLYSRHFPLCKNAVEFEGVFYDAWDHYEEALTDFYGDYWSLPRSISEPHSTELDEGLEEGFAYLRSRGIIPADEG